MRQTRMLSALIIVILLLLAPLVFTVPVVR